MYIDPQKLKTRTNILNLQEMDKYEGKLLDGIKACKFDKGRKEKFKS